MGIIKQQKDGLDEESLCLYHFFLSSSEKYLNTLDLEVFGELSRETFGGPNTGLPFLQHVALGCILDHGIGIRTKRLWVWRVPKHPKSFKYLVRRCETNP